MTKAELRIAVAKDVLKTIKSEKPYKVRTNTAYCRLPALKGKAIIDESTPSSRSAATEASKKTANELKPLCTVCAMGACFLSVVAIDNKFDWTHQLTHVNPKSYSHNETSQFPEEEMLPRLRKVFSRTQLYLIERAFEADIESDWGLAVDEDFGWDRPDDSAAVAFGKKYKVTGKNGTERLAAIMKNIVKNGGTFIP